MNTLIQTLKQLFTRKPTAPTVAPEKNELLERIKARSRRVEFFDHDGNRLPSIEEINQARDEAVASLKAEAEAIIQRLKAKDLEPQVNGGPHASPVTFHQEAEPDAPRLNDTWYRPTRAQWHRFDGNQWVKLTFSKVTAPSLTVTQADGTVTTIKPNSVTEITPTKFKKSRTPKVPK